MGILSWENNLKVIYKWKSMYIVKGRIDANNMCLRIVETTKSIAMLPYE